MTCSVSTEQSVTIEDLPDEVLEFILGLIPPYKDLHDCMLVCKRWRKCVLNVTKTKRRNLHRAITDFDIAWKSIIPVAPTITKRYSHSAAVHDNSMYVFGGCTCSMTTFNDLWRLDLSKRQWVRPLTMGTYPSPKACSTMVCYKDFLVLFGGWTYPPSYPLHQSWHLFNELHIYDITANRWTSVNTIGTPPPTAGHSVTVHGEWMIVFGGLQRPNNVVHSTKSNDIYKLNLETWTWYHQKTEGYIKPNARYGQSQIQLDDDNILIIGGSGGPSFYYSDIWVLSMKGELWKWIPVEVRNSQNAPANLWSNPACKVGDKVIVLNRTRQNTTPHLMYYSKGVWVRRNQEHEDHKSPRIDLAKRRVDRDENVNGRRGILRNQKRDIDKNDDLAQPGSSGQNDQSDSSSGNNNRPLAVLSKRERLEKRLVHLKKMEDRMKKPSNEPEEITVYKENRKVKRNSLGIYVLDIAHALEEVPYVSWLPVKNDFFTEGPEETVLYTLVEGKSELIMFGGIQKDAAALALTTNLSNQVSNSLHFITAPQYVI